MMSNAFHGEGKIKINLQLFAANKKATDRWSPELKKRGYQEHHVISNINQRTKEVVAEVFSRAGLNVNARINKIFLPKEEGIHSLHLIHKGRHDEQKVMRSIHNGRHNQEVNDALGERLTIIKEKGEQEGWTQ